MGRFRLFSGAARRRKEQSARENATPSASAGPAGLDNAIDFVVESDNDEDAAHMAAVAAASSHGMSRIRSDGIESDDTCSDSDDTDEDDDFSSSQISSKRGSSTSTYTNDTVVPPTQPRSQNGTSYGAASDGVNDGGDDESDDDIMDDFDDVDDDPDAVHVNDTLLGRSGPPVDLDVDNLRGFSRGGSDLDDSFPDATIEPSASLSDGTDGGIQETLKIFLPRETQGKLIKGSKKRSFREHYGFSTGSSIRRDREQNSSIKSVSSNGSGSGSVSATNSDTTTTPGPSFSETASSDVTPVAAFGMATDADETFRGFASFKGTRDDYVAANKAKGGGGHRGLSKIADARRRAVERHRENKSKKDDAGPDTRQDSTTETDSQQIFLKCRWTDAGFLVRRTEHGNTVGMIDPGSPAEIAGVARGSIIMSVNGVDVSAFNYEALMDFFSDCDSLALVLTLPSEKDDAFFSSQYVDDDDSHRHGSMVIVKTHGRTTAPSTSPSDEHPTAESSPQQVAPHRRGSMYEGFAGTDLRRKSSDEGLGFPAGHGTNTTGTSMTSPTRPRRDSMCEGFDMVDRRRSSDTPGFSLQSILKSSEHLKRSEADAQAHKDHLGMVRFLIDGAIEVPGADFEAPVRARPRTPPLAATQESDPIVVKLQMHQRQGNLTTTQFSRIAMMLYEEAANPVVKMVRTRLNDDSLTSEEENQILQILIATTSELDEFI
eukprot:m.771046 g.771046  ORF g.771046 m.771046 type:complete len:715 (-) comp23243_c1_seq1:209-2353(-)